MKLKHIFTTLLIAATAIMTACNRPKVIPDKELGAIFRDAMLVNAYLMINNGTNIDSLRIYEPIFARHGYTAEDVQYTIHNFSRRKSAQLGRVLKEAEKEIAEYAVDYEKRVVVLDTIKDVAIRSFKRMVYQDSLIEVKKRADTSKLKLTIEPLQPGTYSVRYKYTYNQKE